MEINDKERIAIADHQIEELKEQVDLQHEMARADQAKLADKDKEIATLRNSNASLKELNSNLWSLWESMAECGELSIGPQFIRNYNELKLKVKKL